MANAAKVDWNDITKAVPAFLTIIIMPLTYSIAYGELPFHMSWLVGRVEILQAYFQTKCISLRLDDLTVWSILSLSPYHLEYTSQHVKSHLDECIQNICLSEGPINKKRKTLGLDMNFKCYVLSICNTSSVFLEGGITPWQHIPIQKTDNLLNSWASNPSRQFQQFALLPLSQHSFKDLFFLLLVQPRRAV